MTAPQSPRENAMTQDKLLEAVGNYLGWLDADGLGVEENTAESLRCLRKAFYASPAPDAGMPPEPMVELPELEVTGYSIPGMGFLVAGRIMLTKAQAAEVIRRCADYALLKSYIQRQGKEK